MESATPPAARREHLKQSVSGVAGGRRRQLAVTLGKGRREAAVQAKRLRRGDEYETDVSMYTVEEDEAVIVENAKAAVEQLRSACRDVSKGALQRRLEALKKVRRILSVSYIPPVESVVEAGVVPLLVECLRFGSPEEQLLEAAWCLSNIACGTLEETKTVVAAVPLLIAHLGEKSDEFVAEQCAWTLGNVAGESEELRDTLIAQGALRPLARRAMSTATSPAKTACWALSNLIKGPNPKAVAELLKVDGILEALKRHLEKGDEALMAEASWVLVYISSLSDPSTVVNAGLLPLLLSCLVASMQVVLLTPVLRTVGNVVSGDADLTDAVVRAGQGLPGGTVGALVRCLTHENRALQKEAAWAISNIAAGTLEHKQLVFLAATDVLVHLLNTGLFDVKREVAYVLGNICVTPSGGPVEPPKPILEHLVHLVNRGCIPGFVNLLKSPDTESSILGLKLLELVMRAVPNGVKLVDQAEGMEAIEMLQFHANEEVRGMANHLMDKYFGDEYGLEDEYGPEAMRALRSTG